MSEHTPGPWRLDGQAGDYVGISGPDWIHLATVVVRLSGDPGNYPTAEANARLIAAAPDLLLALQALLNETTHKNHPEQSQMAIDAIAKATGK